MGILTAARSWLAGPARSDFYGLATPVRRLPEAELAVADAALTDGGPLAERLMRQLREAPSVYRLIGNDGSYELRISTTIGVRGVPRAGWRSRTIPVRTNPNDRELELSLSVNAGIVGMEGWALDGRPWPIDWSVSPTELERIRTHAPWIALPTMAETRAQRAHAVGVLEAWLGEPGALRGKRGVVAVEPPATDEAIANFEHAHGFVLPGAYRDLLRAANGFELGRVVVLGTDDAYRLDVPGPERLVIAPPDEDGALVLAPNGEVRFVGIDDRMSDGPLHGADLRAWVRRRLARPR